MKNRDINGLKRKLLGDQELKRLAKIDKQECETIIRLSVDAVERERLFQVSCTGLASELLRSVS